MRYLVSSVSAALAATFASASLAAATPTSCDVVGQDLTPVGNGPLVLAATYCLGNTPGPPGGISLPTMSPDRTAFFTMGMTGGLWLKKIASDAPMSKVEADVTGLSPFSREQPFVWSNHENEVFGVRQDVMKPRGGWALGPLTTFVASIDGTVRALPPLTSPDGSLDEVHWVGNAGLAIALFGAKGRFYRPEHADPHPTLALVDARAGRVLQSAPLADLTYKNFLNTIREISWRIDKKGRVEALMTFTPDRWVFWKQGEAPQLVPIEIANLVHSPYALSPDGQTFLVMRGLSATGMICERNPNCPPLTPSTGVVSELREVRTGKVIWSITGTAESGPSDVVPAISPDGRYGLISMPGHQGETAALVDMASGKIMQHMPVLAGFDGRLGFAPDGKTAWISGYSKVAEYRISH